MLCIWWNLKKNFVLRANETSENAVDANRYRQQFVNIIQALKWNLLLQPTYSTDLAPFDYQFRSMTHRLSGLHMAKKCKICWMKFSVRKYDILSSRCSCIAREMAKAACDLNYSEYLWRREYERSDKGNQIGIHKGILNSTDVDWPPHSDQLLFSNAPAATSLQQISVKKSAVIGFLLPKRFSSKYYPLNITRRVKSSH